MGSTFALEMWLTFIKYTTSYYFVYEIYFKPFGEENLCGAIINNRKDIPILLLDENGRNKAKTENDFE